MKLSSVTVTLAVAVVCAFFALVEVYSQKISCRKFKNKSSCVGHCRWETSIGTVPVFRHDYKYINNAYYKTHPPMKWMRAVQICAAEGAILAHPSNGLEARIMSELFKNKTVRDPVFWLGLSSLYYAESFRTTDGKTNGTFFKNWTEGYPDRKDYSKRCVIFRSNACGMENIPCDETHRFICRRRSNDTFEVTSISKGDFGYTSLGPTGGMIKALLRKTDLLDAMQRCAREGSSLSFPYTKEEFAVYREIMNPSYDYWVGLYDDFLEGKYRNMDDTSIQYPNIIGGSPKDNTKRLFLSLDIYGIYDRSWGSGLCPYLCARDPKLTLYGNPSNFPRYVAELDGTCLEV